MGGRPRAQDVLAHGRRQDRKERGERQASWRARPQRGGRHEDPSSSQPATLLKSLAAQLRARLPGFSKQLEPLAVEEAVRSGKVEDLFNALLGKPLGRMDPPAAREW